MNAICESYYLACMKFGDEFGRPLPHRVLEIGDDSGWRMLLNATQNKEKVSLQGDEIGPFNLQVLWNGWPAAILDASGGVFAAGSVANEETFLEWLKQS